MIPEANQEPGCFWAVWWPTTLCLLLPDLEQRINSFICVSCKLWGLLFLPFPILFPNFISSKGQHYSSFPPPPFHLLSEASTSGICVFSHCISGYTRASHDVVHGGSGKKSKELSSILSHTSPLWVLLFLEHPALSPSPSVLFLKVQDVSEKRCWICDWASSLIFLSALPLLIINDHDLKSVTWG